MMREVVYGKRRTSSSLRGRYSTTAITADMKMVLVALALPLSLLVQGAVSGPSPAAFWGSWWQQMQTEDCPGPGAFPDTSDACSPVFKICVYMGPVRGLQPIPKSCPAGFVFNVATGCTFKQECFQKLYSQAAAGGSAV